MKNSYKIVECNFRWSTIFNLSNERIENTSSSKLLYMHRCGEIIITNPIALNKYKLKLEKLDFIITKRFEID